MEQLIKIEKMFLAWWGFLLAWQPVQLWGNIVFSSNYKNEGSLQGFNSQTMLAAEIY